MLVVIAVVYASSNWLVREGTITVRETLSPRATNPTIYQCERLLTPPLPRIMVCECLNCTCTPQIQPAQVLYNYTCYATLVTAPLHDLPPPTTPVITVTETVTQTTTETITQTATETVTQTITETTTRTQTVTETITETIRETETITATTTMTTTETIMETIVETVTQTLLYATTETRCTTTITIIKPQEYTHSTSSEVIIVSTIAVLGLVLALTTLKKLDKKTNY